MFIYSEPILSLTVFQKGCLPRFKDTFLACESSWTRMVHQCCRSVVGGSLICIVWFELGARCIVTRFWPRGSFMTCGMNKFSTNYLHFGVKYANLIAIRSLQNKRNL